MVCFEKEIVNVEVTVSIGRIITLIEIGLALLDMLFDSHVNFISM